MGSSLVQFLKTKRFGGATAEVGESSTAAPKPRRGKKLAIAPRKSVSLEEVLAAQSAERKVTPKKRGRPAAPKWGVAGHSGDDGSGIKIKLKKAIINYHNRILTFYLGLLKLSQCAQ